jgi:hypothetical protein
VALPVAVRGEERGGSIPELGGEPRQGVGGFAEHDPLTA